MAKFFADFGSFGALGCFGAGFGFAGATVTFFFETVFVSVFLVTVFVLVLTFDSVTVLRAGVLATTCLAGVDVFLADAGDALALAFQPKRFNLPTTAFLDIPNCLPISDVDKPRPNKDFNFFIVALSQPLLILQNPFIIYYNFITVPIRNAREKNMIFYLFLAILFTVAFGCAIAISVADFRRRIIPDAYLLPLFLIGLIVVNFAPAWICGSQMAAIGAITGYILGAGVGFVFDIIRRHKKPDADTPIGMGDIKLLATGGLWLGPNGLAIAMILSCIFGGIWAAVRHQRFIPFAPFFVAGAILALIAMTFLV